MTESDDPVSLLAVKGAEIVATEVIGTISINEAQKSRDRDRFRQTKAAGLPDWWNTLLNRKMPRKGGTNTMKLFRFLEGPDAKEKEFRRNTKGMNNFN